MSNKFLNSSGGSLTDGSATIYIQNASINGLDPNRPVRTNGQKTLVSGNINISEVTNLQSSLNSKISNPITSDLNFQDYGTTNQAYSEYLLQNPLPSASPNSLRLYANTNDGLLHTVDELGNDIPVGGNAPQFLSSLVVNTLSQGDSAVLTNYTFPRNKPPPDHVLTSGTGTLMEFPTDTRVQFNIRGQIQTYPVLVVIRAGTFSIDNVLTLISSGIRSVMNANSVVADITITFDELTNRFGMRQVTPPLFVNFNGLDWLPYNAGINGNNLFGVIAQLTLNTNTNPINEVSAINPPIGVTITDECAWRTLLNNLIQNDSGTVSIQCDEVGAGQSGIVSYGNYNINQATINNCGGINALDSCNITTATTQIANGTSEIKLITDSVDRLVIDSIKSKMMCGVSALQLSAVSDGLSEDTTTYIGASTGPTQNTISIYTPDQYQVIQNNGAVARIVVDTTSTKLNTKSILTGPQASFVDLNDDGRFAIGSLGANNGIIEATLGNLVIAGGGALSAIELTLSPPKITTSVFNGVARTTREIIDQTTQTFYDPSNVERLRVDASGVTFNNAYRMPTSDGTPSQVLQTNGFGAVGWATPQVYGLFSQTSVNTVANTAVESSLIGTGVGLGLTVPAGYFQDGYSFLYKTGGVFRDSSNGQLIRFRLRNSGVLFDSGILTLSNVNTLRGWNIDCQFTYYAGNIITNFSFNYTDANNNTAGFNNQGTNAINNALPNTLDFTVQWSTASALNTISSNYGTLTKIF